MRSARVFSLWLTVSLCLIAGWALPSAREAEGRSLQEQWQQWKTRYGKAYSDRLQEDKAHALWLRHWHLIQSHNSRSDVTFSLELNAFADQEFRHETHVHESHTLRYAPEVKPDLLRAWIPASFDWREKGVISPVQNQGQLGQSEAIAVTEDLESLHAIRTGQLVKLSVMEVADCCSAFPEMLVPDIYECIARHGGLCLEADYPIHPSVCRNDSCQAVVKDACMTVRLPKGNESALLSAVLQCPLVVYVDADHPGFMLYQGGVYSDPQCSHELDHALQLVGYGTDQGVDYWILKNSWGPEWGIQGYIWMKRGVNMCGIADQAIYPQ